MCPHITVCTLINKCMAGNKSFEDHGGNELRIYGSGPFENVDRLPCNPTVKRNLERLSGGLKGSEPHSWSTDVNEDELSREHLEQSCLSSDGHPSLPFLHVFLTSAVEAPGH